MQYASLEVPTDEVHTHGYGLDADLAHYVDGVVSTVEGLTNVWPYFEPWPWMDALPANLDSVPQLLPRQASTGYSESDCGSSSGSNSQTDPSPGAQGLTRKETRKERRLEQNRAAQRAFRERKEKALVELRDKILLLKQEASELIEENEQLQNALNEAHKTIEVLKSVVPLSEKPAASVMPRERPLIDDPSLESRSFLVKIDVQGLKCRCGAIQTDPALSIAQIGCHEQPVLSVKNESI